MADHTQTVMVLNIQFLLPWVNQQELKSHCPTPFSHPRSSCLPPFLPHSILRQRTIYEDNQSNVAINVHVVWPTKPPVSPLHGMYKVWWKTTLKRQEKDTKRILMSEIYVNDFIYI